MSLYLGGTIFKTLFRFPLDMHVNRKRRDLTQSYDKKPYTNRKFEKY